MKVRCERLVQSVAFGAQLAPQLGIETRQRFIEEIRSRAA